MPKIVKFNHSDIFPKNPMLMIICGGSGCGKTLLTFKMLTTPNLLDFENLYIYTSTPNQSYYHFLSLLEFLDKKTVQDAFFLYENGDQENSPEEFIEQILNQMNPERNQTNIKVKVTKNKMDVDVMNINPTQKNLIIFDDCVGESDQSLQRDYFTKGRHMGCHCIYQTQSFYGTDSQFIRKNANCFVVFELNDKDMVSMVQSIPHGMGKEEFKKTCKHIWGNPDDYGYLFINTRKQVGQRVMGNIC